MLMFNNEGNKEKVREREKTKDFLLNCYRYRNIEKGDEIVIIIIMANKLI